jgi:hypothetical protein
MGVVVFHLHVISITNSCELRPSTQVVVAAIS